MTFGPSLVLSLVLNLAVFAVLEPIQVTARQVERRPFRLHRLQRLAELPPPAAEPAPELETPEPARQPAARPMRRTPGEPGGSRRATRPSGGDGTATRLAAPNTGGGDPLTARPREAGRQPGATLPGLGPEPPAQPMQVAQAGPIVDGPPIIMPGRGDRGGTGHAPNPGRDPRGGVAGSGDLPRELAPATTSGFRAPLAPTTPGPRLRDKAGPGLPEIRGAPTVITAADVVPGGRSGGGGGTARTPGAGGGGPALRPDDPAAARARGGGGSGHDGDQPGGLRPGAGPGGTGGGGNGLGAVGAGGGAETLTPATSGGRDSIVNQPGFGDGATAVRPGPRGAGPGGPPGPTPAAMPARGPVGDGGGTPGGRGTGSGTGTGTGNGSGPGSGGGGAASRSSSGGSGATGVVIDTLALRWHHIPGSYDLHIGSADGPRLATIGVIRSPSVGAARASDRVQRDGRREVLTIRPIAIEYIMAEGQGARQRVVISADDAAKLRASGILQERDRIITVYKGNY